ncbi:superoxide dismutase family protein [Rubricoccus marinus]|uniref:Superoxide dismutase copper/zinc binding domain-containing protein n=1 Tax=Rubricoccus marinus TaxID=716817 RepID=A0A259TYJ5_9BACT|nr:superoxide dismutase family protein [Rubricoccus marinus]OZC02822.1 hypothetical protein BSZ36_07450 [Rubricoccus marinus]
MRLLPFLLLGLAACAQDDPTPLAPEASAPRAISADTVDVQGVSAARAQVEGDVTGTVTLRRVGGGTRVLMSLDGLGRDRFHGVQILSARSCDDLDPARHLGDGRATHGPYDATTGRRHAGDLGNIKGDDRRRGRFDRIDPVVSLDGYVSAVGRAVVVRASQDDGWASGGGEVIGCGVLTPTR